MNNANTQAAKTLGAIAFATGVARAPALDAAFMEMIAGREVGEARNVPEMKAWIAGWTEACLSAPVAA